MQFYYLVSLALAASTAATPLYANVEEFRSVRDLKFVSCNESSTDPNCALAKRPVPHVLSSTLLADGTWSKAVPSNWTREALEAVRKANNVTSNAVDAFDPVAHQAKSKRESAPPICVSSLQQWYDTQTWGYWYQPWHQVGNCFYCDTCTDAIAVGFSVTDTWTAGLTIGMEHVMEATFSFSNAQQTTLTETRTCEWNKGDTWGCHTIWYQPLMVYHYGWPNYQTHTHCYAGAGEAASDSYYDHNWVWTNVNQAGSGGVNLGNLGCGSGCGGSDHRQCTNGNNGGMLWPKSN